MTDYTLTIGNDNFPGTPAADTFSGPDGGTDTLNGAGGNDTFAIHGIKWGISDGQQGTIDGGSGTDTVVQLEHDIHDLLTFSNVEILDLTNVSGLGARIAHLTAFSTILVGARHFRCSASISLARQWLRYHRLRYQRLIFRPALFPRSC